MAKLPDRKLEDMRLTNEMHMDICHHLNNDLAIIMGSITIAAKLDKNIDHDLVMDRLQLMAHYIKSLKNHLTPKEDI